MTFLEQLERRFERQDNELSAAWREWFQQLPREAGPEGRSADEARSSAANPHAAHRLADAYRTFGHLAARLDPLGLARRVESERLAPQTLGLTEQDLDSPIGEALAGLPPSATIAQLAARLPRLYCGTIGYEFMQLEDADERNWWREQIEEKASAEATDNEVDPEALRRTHRRLAEAAGFEKFVRTKYPGAKTFSLEGSESLIPLLDRCLQHASAQQVEHIVIGMAHRGRLNVLANIIGKPFREIFQEFEDKVPEDQDGRGDVKYHLGHQGTWTREGDEPIRLSLCFNPSHLEFVNPVVLGRVRARQDQDGDSRRRTALALLIHGDAGFAGEGIVQETLNLSELPDYDVGGALHVILNNQIGFTTPPAKGRSGRYATDAARLLGAPILHVNGEDLEGVIRAATLACEYRQRFGRDVILDLVAYRRWGHNESDEPGFTQPVLYRAIEHHQPVLESYEQRVLAAGAASPEELKDVRDAYRRQLDDAYDARNEPENENCDPAEAPPRQSRGDSSAEEGCSVETRSRIQAWTGGPEPAEEADTALDENYLQHLLRRLTETPDDFHLHKRLRRSMQRRREMAQGSKPVDWSAAEALAWASLAEQGHRIRLAGQDSERGTFSQRHAVLHDVVDGHPYSIFQGLDHHPGRGEFPGEGGVATEDGGALKVEVINSPLSEAGAMAFEYGYSLEASRTLVMWEAQFGDFVNAAQVVIDQFLTSAEDKWNRLSSLVLLLPHGFEGQGPEHSSARLERFLTLASEDNLQIVQPTTAAQLFHCLRRQAGRAWRKPLIVLTPKSLLRHPEVSSPWSEFAQGRFQRVLPDRDVSHPRLLLLCSGKVYYDLLAHRREQEREDVAIARVEQFYPLRDQTLRAVCEPYACDVPVRWVQEEPRNMGAWSFWHNRFGDRFLGQHPLDVAARPESASPATGSKSRHKREQQALMEQAFAGPP